MGACSSGLRDIEDIGCARPNQPLTSGSRGLPPSEDVQWLGRLQAERGVEPLYRAQDIRVVHIELTTRCNAACPQCMRNDSGGQENPLLGEHHAELSVADVRRILPPSLLRQLKKVFLCGNYGDPGVAKECMEVLKYLCSVKCGAKVGLFTNGGMRSPEWWAELGSIMQPAERAFVRFAIDGDGTTNHLYRQHVDWGRLMANVRAFLAAGGNAEWDFIVFAHNEHQVEQMRALAEQLGFTKFSAKKTSRFLDRRRGGVLESTPVKDVRGEVVRHLRPPKAPEWQNSAAVHDAQETLAVHGNMEAYYDVCDIKCKAAVDKELYISAEGLAFPCCWIAGDVYNMRLKDADRQIVRLLEAADPLRGIQSQSVLGREGVRGVVDRKAGLFHKLVHAAARQRSVAAGRLTTCSKVCGTQVRAFAKQFEGAGRDLDPALKVPIVAATLAPQQPPPVHAGHAAPLLVWYASETGNAERLARSAAAAFGVAAEVAPVPQARFEEALAGRAGLLLVLATWGEGEPTSDAQAFFAWLGGVSAPGPAVVSTPVALYGVGSSHWPCFNAAARRAAELLAMLGARQLVAPGEGDAAAGDLDGPFAQWLGGQLIPALGAIGVEPKAGAPLAQSPLERSYDKGVVGMAVRSVRRLAPEDPEAAYWELELAGPLKYGAADSVGVLPPAQAGASEPRPRWYTSSSSPSQEGELTTLRLTVREVPGGACSPWLCSLREGATVRCLPPRRPSPLVAAWRAAAAAASGATRLPPLLFVANGAGVAPFIGLLELLAGLSAAPAPECRMWMGCRSMGALPQADRLAGFQRSGALRSLAVAESRPAGAQRRRYVQDAVADDADEVGEALFSPTGPGGVMLVCGSAAMGSAVRSTLSRVAARFGSGVDRVEAERRLVFELW